MSGECGMRWSLGFLPAQTILWFCGLTVFRFYVFYMSPLAHLSACRLTYFNPSHLWDSLGTSGSCSLPCKHPQKPFFASLWSWRLPATLCPAAEIHHGLALTLHIPVPSPPRPHWSLKVLWEESTVREMKMWEALRGNHTRRSWGHLFCSAWRRENWGERNW